MELSEFQLIDRIRRILGAAPVDVRSGIGDDCAVVKAPAGFEWVATVDCQVDGVHFSRDYFTPEQAGFKAIAVAVSDIAAMGASPKHVLISLGIPPSFTSSWILRFYKGVKKACRQMGVGVIGGNLSQSPGFWASVTVWGSVRPGKAKLRSHARVGDFIYVTGPLGNSALGLERLRRDSRDRSRFAAAHRAPTPRLKEGIFLGGLSEVGAMVDLSDGLLADLNHVLTASRVGAIIELNSIPVSPGARKAAARLKIPFERLALSSGEDYELLFTVRPSQNAAFLKQAESRGFYPVGRITPFKEGFRTNPPLKNHLPSKSKGYLHF